MVAARQLQLKQPRRGPLAPLLQRGDLLVERPAGHVRQWMRAPPQLQRLPQKADLILGPLAGPRFGGLPHQLLEPQSVGEFLGYAYLVPEPRVRLEVVTAADLGEQGPDRHHALVQLRFGDLVIAPRRAD